MILVPGIDKHETINQIREDAETEQGNGQAYDGEQALYLLAADVAPCEGEVMEYHFI